MRVFLGKEQSLFAYVNFLGNLLIGRSLAIFPDPKAGMVLKGESWEGSLIFYPRGFPKSEVPGGIHAGLDWFMSLFVAFGVYGPLR